ncbi:NitT/TauT family transport system substrate-binding protein [Allocatelliglobosispora scoriae]|uniref:NitT/TauT family transport system substrate-binding protein n=1 Tax=Allocatelliglobosispora scoriae TaxID=643052 RepID=A0A841BQ47_9ACTN|nr:ABC transporter substrate-binding protein [Allocatelliglobosispora scoriae]MBB5869309.1 NitT/TauT family transport system substrate-binding protein [Allocatelliglobosispora scoriae]
MRRPLARLVISALVLAGMSGLAACGSEQEGDGTAADPLALRLGHFPNLTHATPVIGVEKKFFATALGDTVKLETKQFNAGPEAIEALFAGAIDATYIGPNPAINAYAQSDGQAVRIVAGAASGGVSFIVKPGITKDGLRGKTIATPQLGNTQDVALRYWLKQRGLTTTKEGGGDVSIKPQANSDTVTAFAAGKIDGAWVPEPFASRLIAAGGVKLLDESELWPDGLFVITHLLVSKKFLDKHPTVVKNLVKGSVATNEWINANPDEAQRTLNEALGRITGKPLDAKLTAAAWPSLKFTDDPIPSSLRDGAAHAVDAGLLDQVDLKDIYDLSFLNQVLADKGQPGVKS